MARVSFKKYQGLGNDFIVVDLERDQLADGVVEKWCDRHFGIGADGVLFVGPPKTGRAAAAMTIINADGSRPEMCGNGIRCVAVHVASRDRRDKADMLIDTDAGTLECKRDGEFVEVDMGPLSDHGPIEVPLGDEVHRFARFSTGNPHAITFDLYESAQIDEVGPKVTVAPAFPEGTNVEFARLRDDGAIDLVVWERGVGRTMACGTGACATVGAACFARRRSFDEFVDVHLPGGTLQILVKRDSLHAIMRGPARLVFQGEVELS
ncbi:MAG TPA: diaminopimelate epimerase [Polyangiaceae bacterium]|nr:diaminopimelate epimerase [Polyangiaceae bacterium]